MRPPVDYIRPEQRVPRSFLHTFWQGFVGAFRLVVGLLRNPVMALKEFMR